MTKLYIGNLSLQTTEQDLQNAFEAFGGVQSVNIVRAKSSGDSLGYGFVMMPGWEDAVNAIKAMNGHEFKGQLIKVELGKRGQGVARARTQKEKSKRTDSGRRRQTKKW